MSSTRLIIMPLVLLPIYVLVGVISGGFAESSGAFMAVSMIMFAFLVYIWGNRQASDAVVGEVNGQTWHFQKMTSISPLQMALGKLFGSTIFTWYGAAITSAVYLAAAATTDNLLYYIKLLISYILIGVFSHALCISLTLMRIRKNTFKNTQRSALSFLICMVLSIYAAFKVRGGGAALTQNVEWFDIGMRLVDFNLISFIIFTVWAIIGLNRSLRTELQYENKPWVWIGFVTFTMIYLSGFLEDWFNVKVPLLAHLCAAGLIPVVLTYFMALSEPKNPVDFRLIFQRAKVGDWDRVAKNLPLWFITLVITYIIGISIIGTSFAYMNEQGAGFTMIILSILLLITRDLCILLFFNFAPNQKRADMTAFVCFILLYILIPLVMGVAGAEKLLPAFYPDPGFTRYSYIGIFLLAGEVGLAIFLVINRWKKVNRELNAKYADVAG